MPYLGIFRLDFFKKTIVIFKISALEFVLLQFFAKKQKRSILGPKMPYLDVFKLEFENNIVTLEICAFELI